MTRNKSAKRKKSTFKGGRDRVIPKPFYGQLINKCGCRNCRGI